MKEACPSRHTEVIEKKKIYEKLLGGCMTIPTNSPPPFNTITTTTITFSASTTPPSRPSPLAPFPRTTTRTITIAPPTLAIRDLGYSL
ncbi:hypothetical protein E2C01_022843 [Portunus trituberculatus]|uniref:Uncharacterized protein n=1 Tax=Portunus trituberculatus TaxID=210409 RepID=A0A5B7E6G7_PORTR|nr:hypothetical protein [Portunus trituberculatus]